MKLKKKLQSIASSLWARYNILKIYMRTFAVHGTPSSLLEYICIMMDLAFLLSANTLIECPQNTYFAKFLPRVASNKVIAEFFGKIYCSLKCEMKGYQSKLLLKNTYVSF